MLGRLVDTDALDLVDFRRGRARTAPSAGRDEAVSANIDREITAA